MLLHPQDYAPFVTAMPVWIKEKLFLKNLILKELAQIGGFDKKARNAIQLLFPEHHLSHAASAFFPSPFHEAAILTIDGVGEWATASICHGRDHQIAILAGVAVSPFHRSTLLCVYLLLRI